MVIGDRNRVLKPWLWLAAIGHFGCSAEVKWYGGELMGPWSYHWFRCVA